MQCAHLFCGALGACCAGKAECRASFLQRGTPSKESGPRGAQKASGHWLAASVACLPGASSSFVGLLRCFALP